LITIKPTKRKPSETYIHSPLPPSSFFSSVGSGNRFLISILNFFWNTGDMEYVGEYKDGKKHGKGRYTWSDGGIYIGNWKDGKEHGQGTYTSPAGTKYVGEWKEGKYDGQGTETLSNGWKYVGEWREGKPWNITIYGKSGIIIMEYVNGVEQK
tara:strand:+ start:177 stop:635 length:459 start_codon:yes stop_codon:yes gene_type:complete